MSGSKIQLTVLPSPVGTVSVVRRSRKTQNEFPQRPQDWLAIFTKLGMNARCRMTITASDLYKGNKGQDEGPFHEEIVEVPDSFTMKEAVIEGRFLNLIGSSDGELGKTNSKKVMCIDLSMVAHASCLWTVIDSAVIHFHIGALKYTLLATKHVPKSEVESASVNVPPISDPTQDKQAELRA